MNIKQKNIKKNSIGLLFLIITLVFIPGASALPSYSGGTAAHMVAAAPNCAGGCHNMPVFCAGCHAYPYATPTPVLTTISVTPLSVDVLVNGTQAFAAAPKDQNGNAIDATITWTSSNTDVGTIDATGKFTALAAGTSTIEALSGTVSGTAAVTVSSPVVVPVLTTITVTPLTVNVLGGATQTFTAGPKDQNGNAIDATITWSSSNTDVGTIDETGSFTALAAGTSTIEALSGTVNGTATVTVTDSTPLPVLTTITVTPLTANVLINGTQTFAAAPKDQNGNAINATITWTSSNTDVGTIDETGNFTALSLGTALVNATNGTVTETAIVTVTQEPPVIQNLILNPGFESGTSSWDFWTNGTGTFTENDSGYAGLKSAKIEINTPGTNTQLYQMGITLEPNTRYRLSFSAYSATGHDLQVDLIKHGSPYTYYGLITYRANLSTSWQTFTTEFITQGFTDTVNDGRLRFWLPQFAGAGDIYYIDDVKFEKVQVIQNLLLNPGYELGNYKWDFYTNGNGSFTTESPGYVDLKSAKIAINSPGTNEQLYQAGLSVEPNTRYRLMFEAKSTGGNDISVELLKHVSPFTNYGLDKKFDLTPSWQEFSTEFTTGGFTNTANDGRLKFWLAPFAQAGDVYNFDNVSLEKIK